MSDVQKFDGRAIIQKLWNGEIPLFKTFWIYYFAIIVILSMLTAFIPMIGVLRLIWAGFMVKPIWLAADKYAGEKIWATLAKIFAILIALSVFGNLLFSFTA